MKTRNSIVALLAIVVVLIARFDHLPEKRIYSLDHHDNAVVSTDLYFNNKRKEFDMPKLKPEPKSDYVLKSGYDFRNLGSSILSISGDRKFFLISTGFYISDNYKLIIDGKRIRSSSVTEYSIYEPSKDIFHYIGASCLYEVDYYYEPDDHGETIKEVGFKYYPADWLCNELLLVETKKDNVFYYKNQDPKVSCNGFEVPYATARAMSFSLKDFKLSPTNKFKPLKPWVSYSDAQTGIIGYFDPFYKFPSQYFTKPSFPQSYDNKAAITSLTDLKCTKTYDLLDLSKKILPEKYTLVHSSFCGAIIDDMGKRICYYCMTGYPEDFNFGTEQDGLPSLPKIEQIVFKLNFDSGEIEKCLTTDQIHSEIRRLYGDTHDTTKTFSFFYECVADGITKETGPVMIIIGAFPDQKKEVDDWAFFFCRVVGKNLDKLEKTGLDDKTKLNPSFFIR
ncbi:MAG TPA: hypothetical protein PLX04_08720 [Caldisericia bacterium]|nr:hypothetical protein [Caldisericia bacterium]HPL90320.1 hypothetical protein [Caldisericia bacterium]HQG59525.1 hypothetical protein [Caldisericia bacterium]HQH48906.1 hypothetical protein [Caldisericia bacterium]HQJ44520.1 hypothetical protein [Caldisericia bacterium]